MATLGDLTEGSPTQDPLFSVLTTCTICQIGCTPGELIEDDILTRKQTRECSMEISADARLVESLVFPNGCSVFHGRETRP